MKKNIETNIDQAVFGKLYPGGICPKMLISAAYQKNNSVSRINGNWCGK